LIKGVAKFGIKLDVTQLYQKV